MPGLWEFVLRHGYGLMFAAVFLEQLGAPVPAVPVLMAMGAMAGLGYYSGSLALLAAVLATLGPDMLWYLLGRWRGDSILGFLCKLSLEPDTCVRTTTNAFDRWGPATLLVAKFIPGLSTVAPPLAGSARLPFARFVAFDAGGALLWSGSSLLLGFLLRRKVEAFAEHLSNFGLGLLVVIGSPLAAWIFWKLWQRERAMRLYRVTRLAATDLKALLDAGTPTHIIDLRAPSVIKRTGSKLPGAVTLRQDEVDVHLRSLPSGAHLVFYCS
ncbi:VTT domain-containing protein [uncultured Paludibaculum sp.]|uniref:VTT domain-containing protein n=1 Tax=uncultured Paludibaculum sp. TaxID=1765020 RepID=UPI002AAAEA5D|nr:VTT domain-containing protein [uncultured Paludibaculum sp.]